jgi:hypothetical protein
VLGHANDVHALAGLDVRIGIGQHIQHILDGLKECYRLMLERRPEANPGEFKETVNYAGQTKFVDPVFVRGTLLEGGFLFAIMDIKTIICL